MCRGCGAAKLLPGCVGRCDRRAQQWAPPSLVPWGQPSQSDSRGLFVDSSLRAAPLKPVQYPGRLNRCLSTSLSHHSRATRALIHQNGFHHADRGASFLTATDTVNLDDTVFPYAVFLRLSVPRPVGSARLPGSCNTGPEGHGRRLRFADPPYLSPTS